jgi:hypothetical protein
VGAVRGVALALVIVPLIVPLIGGCGTANNSAPAPSSGETAASTETVGDGGYCADHERARSVCIEAVAERCRGQSTGCEATCNAQLGSMPGSSEKEPAIRGDMESNQCRERCRQGYEPCLRALLVRCPQPCQ